MFPKQTELDYPDNNYSSNTRGIIAPEIQEENFIEEIVAAEDVSKQISEQSNKLTSNSKQFFSGMGSIQKIKGLKNDIYSFKLESSNFDEDNPETNTYSKPYRISTVKNNATNKTDTLITTKNSKQYRTLLATLDKINNGRGSKEAQKLIEVLSTFDNDWVNTKGQANINSVVDPHVVEFLQKTSKMYSFVASDISNAQDYFAHIASLCLRGEFADTTTNNRLLIQLHGIKDGTYIIGAKENEKSSYYDNKNNFKYEENEERHNNLKEMLSTQWYAQESFSKDLNIKTVVRIWSELGAAFRNSYYSEFGPAYFAGNAAEKFVGLVHESITGETKNSYFLNKLKDVNSHFDGSLDDYVYIAQREKGKLTPSEQRNHSTHLARDPFNLEVMNKDNWAALYFMDLSKAVVSAMTNEQTSHDNFDQFARTRDLITGKNPVKFLPKSYSGIIPK